MALIAFGKVAVSTAGTRVRATSTQSDPTARVGLQSVQFQALPGNTGKIYVGTVALVASTFVGVLGVLPKPSDVDEGPFSSASFSIPLSGTGLDLRDFYLDAQVSGEGVIITGTVQ